MAQLITDAELEARAGNRGDSYRYKAGSKARKRARDAARELDELWEIDPELAVELLEIITHRDGEVKKSELLEELERQRGAGDGGD